jgi:hypothetical protein
MVITSQLEESIVGQTLVLVKTRLRAASSGQKIASALPTDNPEWGAIINQDRPENCRFCWKIVVNRHAPLHQGTAIPSLI